MQTFPSTHTLNVVGLYPIHQNNQIYSLRIILKSIPLPWKALPVGTDGTRALFLWRPAHREDAPEAAGWRRRGLPPIAPRRWREIDRTLVGGVAVRLTRLPAANVLPDDSARPSRPDASRLVLTFNGAPTGLQWSMTRVELSFPGCCPNHQAWLVSTRMKIIRANTANTYRTHRVDARS